MFTSLEVWPGVQNVWLTLGLIYWKHVGLSGTLNGEKSTAFTMQFPSQKQSDVSTNQGEPALHIVQEEPCTFFDAKPGTLLDLTIPIE